MEDQVRAAQRGDPAAMQALMASHAPWLGRICGSIALDRGDDALQETFIVILRNLVALREPAAFRSWARRIAVRESLRVLRPEREVLSGTIPDVRVDEQDLATEVDVRRVLEQLPPEHRAVLVLRHLEDLGEDDVAATLRIAPGTVKSRLHRAALGFRRRWER